MTNDFDWTHLRESLEQVEFLQEAVLDGAEAAMNGTKEELIEYNHFCYALFEKQHMLWTRLSLMKMEELNGISAAIEQFCDALGKPASQPVSEFHTYMKNEAKMSLSALTGEPIESFENVDVDIRWE